MIQSMTAFASRTGGAGALIWAWEMRGVNARGLDLRLRFPDGQAALEATARSVLTAKLSRGNVTLNLRIARNEAAGELTIDTAQLDRVLAAFEQVQERAFAMGVTLAQPTAADVLAQRGVVLSAPMDQTPDESVEKALAADLDALIADFLLMRKSEGMALAAILTDQLNQIDTLVTAAASALDARREDSRANLRAALRRVFEDVPELDETRIAQELALIAVKQDVTEEIDRLRAHVAAALEFLTDPKPQGRKLDFLAQEFNREANTLCSKAQSADLTRIGLDLKAVIDQMREQIQNVE
ncbi:MAG: YicC family protein [Rhodobacterales bacterium]|jgi:uncharacterized protein (TIGR00255 family)|nr:YicC family protein [Rhodobacterales bacterium]